MQQQSIEPIKQISKYVIRILGMNPGPFTLYGTNTYLIGTGEKRILIDCGQNIPEYKDLLAKVLKDTNSHIDQVILTHCHPDHSGGIRQVMELSQKDIRISKFKLLEADLKLQQEYGFQYNLLQDGQEIQGQGFTIKTIEMSGHNPDHVCYFLNEEKALFTGDFILSGSSSVVQDMEKQIRDYYRSIDLKAEMLLAGHGPEIYGVEEVKKEIEKNLNHRLLREKQILEALDSNKKKSKSLEDIFNMVYPNITQEKLKMGAILNITQHLKKLVNEKKVTHLEQDNTYQLYQSTL